MHRASPRWIAGAVVAASLAVGSAEAAIAQVPDLPDPGPVPTVTPPPLPDPPPVPRVPEIPDAPVPPAPVPPAPVPPAPVPILDPPDVPGLPTAPGVEPRSGDSGGGSGAAARAPDLNTSAGGAGDSATAARGGDATGGAPQRSTPGAAPARRPPSPGTRARSAARPPVPVQRRERRLRRTVERLSACLAAIAGAQRRVLVLRAGVGPRRPQTRHAVARRLDTSVRRIARTERRGLHALRDSARAGRCGAPALVASAQHGDGLAGAGTGTPAAGPIGAAPGTVGDGAPAGGSGVKDEFRTSGPPEQPDPLAPSAGDDGGAPILLLLALAFLAGFAGVWTLERHRHHGGHAA